MVIGKGHEEASGMLALPPFLVLVVVTQEFTLWEFLACGTFLYVCVYILYMSCNNMFLN